MSSKGRNSNKRPQRWGSNSSLGPTVGGSRPSSPAVSQSHLSNGQSPAPSQPKPNASEVAEVNKHMHDRLIFLIVSLVGTKVVATLKGGAKLEGILSSATTEGELGICLKLPMDLSQPESTLPRTMLIFGKDLQEITSADVDLEEKADEPKMAFKTDTDISNGTEKKEKELQKWSEAMEDYDAANGMLDWDPNVKKWDQFQTNENLFGTTTNYDEEIYTTKLDRTTADFKEREKKADKLANEILGVSSSNPHIAEERGQNAEGLDEEAKYGAVIRGPNAYVPPAARKAAAAAAASGTATPTTPPQPQPPPSAATPTPVVRPNGATPVVPPPPIPELNVVPARAPERERVIPSVSTRLPTITTSGPSEETSDKPKGELGDGLQTDFRRFVTNEKERLVQKKQALARKEKYDKLADLKEFSASFKLKTPVPPDLAQIIKKKEEITPQDIKASPQAPKPISSTATTPVSKLKLSLGPISQIPPFNPNRTKPVVPPAKPAAAPTAVERVNITHQFKPNPNANTFTPLNGQGNAASSSASSPAVNQAELAPNQFFGDRALKKGASIYVKEDFSPFKNGTPQDPSSVSWVWPFGTKPYRTLFPFSASEVEEQTMPPPNAMPPHQPMPYAAFPYHQPQFRPGQSPQPHPQAMHPMGTQPMYPQFMQVPFGAPVSMAQSHAMTAAVPGVYSPQMGAMVPPGAIPMQPVYAGGRPMPHAYAYPTPPVQHFPAGMHPPPHQHYVEQ